LIDGKGTTKVKVVLPKPEGPQKKEIKIKVE